MNLVKTAVASTAMLISGQLMAHSGHHDSSLMIWLGHMLSSVYHVIALIAVAAMVGTVAAISRHLWKNRKNYTTPEKNIATVSIRSRD